MSGSEILILILIFTGMLIFIFSIYSYMNNYKNRLELGRRIKLIETGISPKKEENLLTWIKESFFNLIRLLGSLLRPKEGDISHLRQTLLKAGYRVRNTPVLFFGIKLFLAISLSISFSLIKLTSGIIISSITFLFISILLAIIGFYLPNLWVKFKISHRKEKIQQGLPDALDLMVVCVEAGTGLDAAINRVGEEMRLSNKLLSEEFRLMAMELRAGKDRREALRNLATRVDSEDVKNLVTLLIQTEKFGTSLTQALRIHSDFMRTKRFQKAEEIAAKLPVKLIFPLVLFIFPSLFLTILGPAAIRLFRALFPIFSRG